MLTSQDVKKDLKQYAELDKIGDEKYFRYAVVKLCRLAVRLLLGIRVNQVRIMKVLKVDLLETKGNTEKDAGTEEKE